MSVYSPVAEALAMIPENYHLWTRPEMVKDYFYRSYNIASGSQTSTNEFVWALLEDGRYDKQMEIVCERYANLPPLTRSIFSAATLRPVLVEKLLTGRPYLKGYALDEVEFLVQHEDLTVELFLQVLNNLAYVSDIGIILFDSCGWLKRPLTFEDVAYLYSSSTDAFLEKEGTLDGDYVQVADLLIDLASTLDETLPASWIREMFNALRRTRQVVAND